MQLVSNYLNEVSRFLPSAERADILVELRASIEEQIADSAATHGRTPCADDEKSVLQRFGHPLKVASGYQAQRYLIGPALFPAFVQTLKVVLVFALSIHVVLSLVAASVSDWTGSPGGLVIGLLETTFFVTALVGAAFATMEYSGERLKWYESWQPESLAGRSFSVVDRGAIATNLVTEGVFLLWWNDALAVQQWLPVLNAIPAQLSDAWTPLFWPFNIVAGAFFALHMWVLARGLWHRVTLVAEILIGLAALGMVLSLALAGVLVDVPALAESNAFEVLQRTARISLLVVAGFLAWDAWLATRLLSRRDE